MNKRSLMDQTSLSTDALAMLEIVALTADKTTARRIQDFFGRQVENPSLEAKANLLSKMRRPTFDDAHNGTNRVYGWMMAGGDDNYRLDWWRSNSPVTKLGRGR